LQERPRSRQLRGLTWARQKATECGLFHEAWARHGLQVYGSGIQIIEHCWLFFRKWGGMPLKFGFAQKVEIA
jgi:hypothetical protein